jgi:hypothetical protein
MRRPKSTGSVRRRDSRSWHLLVFVGHRACPPEDCGAIGGFRPFIHAIAESSHEGHDEYLDWVENPFGLEGSVWLPPMPPSSGSAEQAPPRTFLPGTAEQILAVLSFPSGCPQLPKLRTRADPVDAPRYHLT